MKRTVDVSGGGEVVIRGSVVSRERPITLGENIANGWRTVILDDQDRIVGFRDTKGQIYYPSDNIELTTLRSGDRI